MDKLDVDMDIPDVSHDFKVYGTYFLPETRHVGHESQVGHPWRVSTFLQYALIKQRLIYVLATEYLDT